MATESPIPPHSDQQTTSAARWRSKLEGPISDLDRLQQSLLFAELSSIAYMDRAEATAAVQQIGVTGVTFLERDGSQAYIFETDDDCAIICRGTEPNEWNDIKADANAVSAVADTVGRVHRGFKQEVDDLWPRIEATLIDNTKTLWFAGHSLGGAMATICAGRCVLSHIPSNPKSLYTYGSPRVGDKRYINYCEIDHVRWVNNNDIVTRVPPGWMGYRHSGREIYLNARGKIRRLTRWQRFKDRLRGLVGGITKGKVDYFSDHSMTCYIEGIHQAIHTDDPKRPPLP